MTSEARYISAHEAVGAANGAYDMCTGEAAALPLPRRSEPTRALHVVVLFYEEGMAPGEETVFPPHHVVTVDPATGDVVESRPCSPSDFGVAQAPGAPTQGFGLDPDLTADEFWELKDRFMDLSPAVWELFASEATSLDPADTGVVRRYDACFRRIAKAPLMPYYEAIAGDFLEWMSEVLGERAGR